MIVSFKMQLPPMHWLDGTAVEQEAVQAIVDGSEESSILAYCPESGRYVLNAMGALIIIEQDYVNEAFPDPALRPSKNISGMSIEEFQSDFNDQVMKSGRKSGKWFFQPINRPPHTGRDIK